MHRVADLAARVVAARIIGAATGDPCAVLAALRADILLLDIKAGREASVRLCIVRAPWHALASSHVESVAR